jgi:hypothetical protein
LWIIFVVYVGRYSTCRGWSNILKAKYYPSGELIDTVFNQNVSPCWQGISHGLELLKNGIICTINSGTEEQIWLDNWLHRGNFKVFGRAKHQRTSWVLDLIDQGTKP